MLLMFFGEVSSDWNASVGVGRSVCKDLSQCLFLEFAAGVSTVLLLAGILIFQGDNRTDYLNPSNAEAPFVQSTRMQRF